MIVGGMHGNEPAGAVAAAHIRHWPITRGRLVVLPRANVLSLEAKKRYTPDATDELKNLNRNFPTAESAENRSLPRTAPQGKAANAIWSVVQQYEPDWLLDLHEGFAVHRVNAKSVGSSVIAAREPQAIEAAKAMLARVNQDVPDERDFLLLKNPVTGSLARAFHDEYQRPAMILETTFADQRLPLRVRQHRLMVQTLLGRLGMLDEDALAKPAQKRSAWRRDNPQRSLVAVFDDRGVGPSKSKLMAALQAGAPAHVDLAWVDAVDVRNGVLDDAAVVVFPGGSGSKQSAALDDAGREAVRQFVILGGGYLGVCAGGYLACDSFSWGLKIVDAKTVSNRWRRGVGKVDVLWEDGGRRLWPEAPRRSQQVHYANGPIWAPNQNDAIEDYCVLATFRSELAKNNTPEGVMLNSPAVISGQFGEGRVVCCSPHFELTAGEAAKAAFPSVLAWLLEAEAALLP